VLLTQVGPEVTIWPDCFYPAILTTPLFASTVIICPSLVRRMALPAPITAGIPYSRATMEPWARIVLLLVTRPLVCENNSLYTGVVVGQANMVPGGIFANLV